MAVDIETVNRATRDYVADVRRMFLVDRAILFGSYAKGTATEYSDVDICFFLRDMDGKHRVDIVAQLLGIGQKYYKIVCFEPAVYPISAIKSDNPFIREVLKTGREII